MHNILLERTRHLSSFCTRLINLTALIDLAESVRTCLLLPLLHHVQGPGDWALHDNAAVRVEGVLGGSITQCVFEDLGEKRTLINLSTDCPPDKTIN